MALVYLNRVNKLLSEGAYSFHVLPISGEPGPPEDVLAVINKIAVVDDWNAVVEAAVDTIGAASPCEEKAEVGAALFE